MCDFHINSLISSGEYLREFPHKFSFFLRAKIDTLAKFGNKLAYWLIAALLFKYFLCFYVSIII